MAYITTLQLRGRGITSEQASNTRLADFAAVAKEIIDGVTKTHFDQVTAAVCYDGRGSQMLYLDDYLQSITKVEYDDEDVTATSTFTIRAGYMLYCSSEVFPIGVGNIKITGVWGKYTTVPQSIVEAAYELVMDQVTPTRVQQENITSERMDDYSYTKRAIASETTGNRRADDLVHSYISRRPRLATPAGSAPLSKTLETDQSTVVWTGINRTWGY